MELKHRLQRDTALDVPLIQLLADTTILGLTELLGAQVPKLAGGLPEDPEGETMVRMEL
jgi:hypothetical protein